MRIKGIASTVWVLLSSGGQTYTILKSPENSLGVFISFFPEFEADKKINGALKWSYLWLDFRKFRIHIPGLPKHQREHGH